MFTRVLTPAKKDEVLASFSQEDGKLHLLVATTAFGMGIDCSDIRRIIHWGMPATLEEYVQETGTSGRDGKPSQAILYFAKRPINTTTESLKYASNVSVCRCRLLFQDFVMYSETDVRVTGCACCDICKNKCTCMVCTK